MKKAILYLFFSISLTLSISISALAGPVPDTGQTTSYTDTYGEDSDYTINPPSYTKLDASGNELPDDATSWVMVRDNVTGLICEVKTDDGSIHDKDNTYTWYDITCGGCEGTPGEGTDTEDFISALNSASFGGFSDWRLPNREELRSIVDYGTHYPSIDRTYFPNTVSSYYWSSTTLASSTNDAWLVDFYGGGYDNYGSKSYSYYVRAVRGGQSGSFDNLVINGDGTVTDTSTGLMWQQAADGGSMTWEAALDYCEDLSHAGYSDWRLPNIKELASIVDLSRTNPSIDWTYFPNTVSSYYWSSTTGASSLPPYTGYAWIVNFFYGSDNNYGKSYSYYVRAVRGGQDRLLNNLVISAPEQADRWEIGSDRPITWETQGISGNSAIYLSRDGGKTFETIEDNTPNDGSFYWTVTGPESFSCILKIEPLSDSTKGSNQGFFSICTLNNAWVSTEKIGGPDKYRLTLKGLYSDGIVPLEVTWSVSDESIATVSGNILNASQNGRVEVTATFEGKTYTKGIFVYTSYEAMEVENNNTKEASNVSNFPMADGTFYRGSFPAGDVDYFKFTLASDSILDSGYLSYITTADMNVEILDNSDTLMASSVSTNGSVQILPLGLPAGTYYLRLTSAGDIDQSNYYVVTYKILDTLPAKSSISLNIGDIGQGSIYNLQDDDPN